MSHEAWAKPSETICIGDEIRDIEAAKAAGMDSGAVAWGYAFPSALQAAGPTHLFNSVEEMTQRLAVDEIAQPNVSSDPRANSRHACSGQRPR